MRVPPVKIIFSEKEKEEIKTKINEVLSSGFLTQGKYCNEFENQFSNVLLYSIKYVQIIYNY